MSPITDVMDKGDIEEASFLGYLVGDMDREELLHVLNWVCEDRERLRSVYFESERSKSELMADLSGHA